MTVGSPSVCDWTLGEGDGEGERERERDIYIYTYTHIHTYIVYCETWMRLCQAHCQEDKRKVPESPLATHCTQRGADSVCNTLVPETGPPFWKPFLLPAILRPRFLGQFLVPFFLTTQTGAARRSWRPGFSPFASASLPSAMPGAMTHTSAQYYEGTWCRSCFESVKRVHFPGPQEAMLTSCALAACRLYNAYVRKLFCVRLGSVWCAIVAVHPVRALWNLECIQKNTAKALEGT